MATYKVLQDIEAEDKLLGPLTLKQFIFAIITLLLGFLAFMLGRVNILLAIPWIVPMAFFGFMASPIHKDQPNDVWLAARIRFLIKPRKRIWDQSGMLDLVTITAPKKIEKQLTDNLDQKEVKSRLNALASTLDSRGWAVKNVNVNMFTQPDYLNSQNSDRLVSVDNIPQEVPDVAADDDVFDPMSNMVAARFDGNLKKDMEKHIEELKEQAKEGMVQTNPLTPDYSFINTPTQIDPGYTTFSSQVVAPHSIPEESDSFLDNKPLTPEEKAVLENIHKNQEEEQSIHTHEKVVLPLSQKHAPDDKIKELANLKDTSVEAVASLAHHAEVQAAKEKQLSEDQTISLH